MRKIISIFFLAFMLGIATGANGQSYPNLEKVLSRELSSASIKDGRWVFYADKANITKMEKPLVQAALPNFQFFSVTLTNYLGYHVNRGTCLILYDSSKSKIQLVEPLWYNEVNEEFIKLFIGQQFSSKEAFLSFFKEVNELMETGSGYKFINTGFSADSVTYDLGYFKGDSYTTGGNGITSTVNHNQDGVLRKIILGLKDLRLIRYIIINPATKEKKVFR